jgi:hypothetical protein
MFDGQSGSWGAFFRIGACFVPLNLVEHEQEVEDEEHSPLSALLSPLSGTEGSWVGPPKLEDEVELVPTHLSWVLLALRWGPVSPGPRVPACSSETSTLKR